MESGCYFCDDLLRDILLRLPAKTLLRFKTVSKSWRSLITDPLFIKHMNSFKLIIIIRLAYVHEALLSSDLCSPQKFVKLDPHIELTNLKTPILEPEGSSNGLILLKDWYNTHLLWIANLFTREWHAINIPEIKPPKYLNYGFGYDSVNDDYKVISIFSYEDRSNGVSVYSLRKNVWRERDLTHFFTIRQTPYAFLNGKLHWIAKPHQEHQPNYIVSFDVCNEEFDEIVTPLPETEQDVKSSCFGFIGELGGCITVTEFCMDWFFAVAVWARKESGWVRLLRTTSREFSCLVPIAYSKTGDLVLMHDFNFSFVWYDIGKRRVDRICQLGSMVDITKCLESLVSISSYRGSNNEEN